MIDALRSAMASGPNRIALTTAARGTLATLVPLIVLSLLGVNAEVAHFAVIGGLHASMVDVGGAYRNRLVTMIGFGLLAPILMLWGMQLNTQWLAAGLMMLVIGLAGGVLRALGPGGVPFGLNSAIAFLIGLSIPANSLAPQFARAAAYGGGVIWTIVVALAFWQLRPYRRIEQELAGVWQALAALVAAARPDYGTHRTVIARRRHERLIVKHHGAIRDALERARAALGEMRADEPGTDPALGQLLVLIRAASRIGTAVLTLDGIEDPALVRHGAARAILTDAVAEIEKGCRAIAKFLLDHGGELDFKPARDRLSGLASLAERARADGSEETARILEAQVIAIAQAVRHGDAAAEAVESLMDRPHRGPRLTRLSLAGIGPAEALATIRAQLTPQSAIFRHAMRVAIVAAIGAATSVWFGLRHGLWLPMAALVILQPDYGATFSRALERAGGTVAGALLAGILLVTLHGTPMFDVAIGLLLFATFALLRRRYSWGITFLTPLIILLLGVSGPHPWADVIDRIADTLAGAGLAIVAGYVLWPLWQREALAPRLAQAIVAEKTYAAAVLVALVEKHDPGARLPELQRQAEIAAANADAAFQRMLAEPRRQRGRIPLAFALTTYIQRLARHSIALAGYVGTAVVPQETTDQLRELLEVTLDDIATALLDGRDPKPRPNFDEPLEHLRVALTASTEGGGATIAFLLGQLVADTTTLHAGASSHRRD
jgi:Fusaric acid resistance protein-like/FUSC-like inner membrane protein yccS